MRDERGRSVPAMTIPPRVGKEGCSVPSGNLSQRWLYCIQGHAKLDITVAALRSKCCLRTKDSWIQRKVIRTKQLYFLPIQFAALHNRFLFFPPLSTSCLIFSQHDSSYYNYCYSYIYKTYESLELCTLGLRNILSNCSCSKEGHLSLFPWLSLSTA